MNIEYIEHKIVFDVRGGSSILGRLLRLIVFPFKWVFTGKAEL